IYPQLGPIADRRVEAIKNVPPDVEGARFIGLRRNDLAGVDDPVGERATAATAVAARRDAAQKDEVILVVPSGEQSPVAMHLGERDVDAVDEAVLFREKQARFGPVILAVRERDRTPEKALGKLQAAEDLIGARHPLVSVIAHDV